jgi:pimeloyl-ACP methyl ester carboxylesterase
VPLPLELLPLLLAALAGAALLLAVWVLGVRVYYRLQPPRPERLQVRCADGWELTVYRRAPSAAAGLRFREPVLLCHGLAANHYTFDFDPPYSLAHVLSEAGFDCYSLELRGTGRSARPPRLLRGGDFTVDDHVLRDAPAVLAEVLARTGAPRAFWVGHSLGGLVGYALAQGPERERLAGLVALGSPVFFTYRPWMRLAVSLAGFVAWPRQLRHSLASVALAPFLGYVNLPLADVVANTRHIPPRVQRQVYAHLMNGIGWRVLRQFEDWIRHDAFRSFDRRTDWRAGLASLRVPLLALGGTADVLAPPRAVEGQYALAGSEDKTLVLLGREHGSRMDYGHGDLLYGAGVPGEVHPRILQWLSARATPLAPRVAAPAPEAGAHVEQASGPRAPGASDAAR